MSSYIIAISVFSLGVLMLIFVIYTNWINKAKFLEWAANFLFKKTLNPQSSAKDLLAQITPYFLCVGIIFTFLGYNWLF
jgi:hypothetical protein